MTCQACQHQTAGFTCQFSLDDTLENIRKHYKSMETSLEEKSKQCIELTERNNKLMKAIDCLKKPTTLARLNSFSEQCDKPTSFRTPASQLQPPSPIFEDITIIDDDEEDNALVSVMDTALNGSALNTTINNEVITETELPKPRELHVRRLSLKPKPKATTRKISDGNNDENKKPTTIPSPLTKVDQNLSDWNSKQKLGNETLINTSKSFVKRLALKQTRLPFDEKRERSPNANKLTRLLTLGRVNKKTETKPESDEDVFDFNKFSSFQFKSPTPKKSKFNYGDTDVFTSPKKEDVSLMAIASQTQTIHFLDDTTYEERQSPKFQQKEKVLNDLGEETPDSLADFDMPDENAIQAKQSIPTRSVKATANETPKATKFMQTNRKIKEEPLTQERNKNVVNPIFKDSDTAEESDDDFMVRPIQIKIELEQEKHIDIDKIDCMECRNYIKYCGKGMTTEELEEHIRNCMHHNEPDNLGEETPDGFWNPLLLSFNTNDPRNEVLVDNRFVREKTAEDARKNS